MSVGVRVEIVKQVAVIQTDVRILMSGLSAIKNH